MQFTNNIFNAEATKITNLSINMRAELQTFAKYDRASFSATLGNDSPKISHEVYLTTPKKHKQDKPLKAVDFLFYYTFKVKQNAP